MNELPQHGRISCRDCFPGSGSVIHSGHWQMRNDPGAWGAQEPKYIVLGFSKGATQVDIYQNGHFDDVAFGGKQTRDNLTRILRKIGFLSQNEHVDGRINASEREFHFASLVRCSLGRRDDAKSAAKGYDDYKTSGNLIVKSFNDVPEVIRRCSSKYLSRLPLSLKAILVLGTTDAYIARVRATAKALHPTGFKKINEVAYQAGGVLWLHVTHPSKGNGHLNAWLTATTDHVSGRKRELACETLRRFGLVELQ